MFHVPTPEYHRGDGGTEYPQMAQMDTDEKTDEEDDGLFSTCIPSVPICAICG
jgi:hypothetical protein